MELIKMTRGDDVANVRPEWVEQWGGWGWEVEQAAKPEDGAGTGSEQSNQTPPDELDALDAEQLHALAKERGVKVHANAGADKVREALRQAA